MPVAGLRAHYLISPSSGLAGHFRQFHRAGAGAGGRASLGVSLPPRDPPDGGQFKRARGCGGLGGGGALLRARAFPTGALSQGRRRPSRLRAPRARVPGAAGPELPRSLGPAAAGAREGKPGPPETSARCSGPERPLHRLPLQMLLLPPRPPHPRSSSPEAMDPPPPKAPPFPKAEGSSSSPSSASGPRPPRLGRHLLIDANGVPYTYTVQLEEEPRGPPQREAPAGEPAPRKGYSCPECARVFASPLRLQSHRVSHSDLKPFTCGACGKAFKRSSHLSRHRATHRARAGPPHTCPLCPRRFQDAAELAQHVRLH
ncbi:zinc finger protein 580 [Choloepus didactylus]|uniref:zinc finger protein 580 n=1 Tax=Choloepus didactylus TaxID=27675 RepID=UPI00189FDE55|nr:zinc finger protein 580 [Choloepus didactylus]